MNPWNYILGSGKSMEGWVFYWESFSEIPIGIFLIGLIFLKLFINSNGKILQKENIPDWNGVKKTLYHWEQIGSLVHLLSQRSGSRNSGGINNVE